MDRKLLEILVCPVTRQPLQPMDAASLQRLNARIDHGGVRFGGHAQLTALREALITRDGRRIYRVDDGIPVLLPDESVDASVLDAAPAA